MRNLFAKCSERLGRLHPALFVYLVLFFSYAVLLPQVALEAVIHNEALHINGGPSNLPAFGPVGRLIVASLIAPLVETALFQWAPIRLLHTWLRQPAWLAVLVSAVLFGMGHTYSLGYVVFTFLVGLVLAFGFQAKNYRGGHPYLLICIVHALRNVIAVFLM
ncbi:MAG: CPBP family intramembrane metalloprotease [Burkholderiaceae bacterium]|nr:CPBP family intramembrane metalloprotease [Burkholderiaceae bacterium]